MRLTIFSFALFLGSVALSRAQANDAPADPPATKWDVFIPLPEIPTNEEAVEAPAPPLLKFKRPIASNAIMRHVTEAPPMEGLPPVSGWRVVTLEVVKPPQNYSPPLPPAPVVEAAPEEEQPVTEPQEEQKASNFIFVSATVYDSKRTFVTIRGGPHDEVTAWSNINFNMLSGVSSYQLRNVAGEIQERALLMGIGDYVPEAEEDANSQADGPAAPHIPPLPDIAEGGPAFKIVSADPGSPALESLEQLHDLFRKEGARITADHEARKQAETTRKAELLANPPKPENVIIRYWKGEAHASGQGGDQ